MSSNDWKNKFQGLLNTCQNELKRTKKIGIKMIQASQSNTELKEKYESLGKLTLNSIEENKLEWNNQDVQRIISEIKRLENELEQLENDVQDIKEV